MIHKDKQDKWFHDDNVTTTKTGDGFTVYGNPPPTEGDKFKVTRGQDIVYRAESILSEAERIVNGDRQADYSDPVENFKHISSIASAISKKDLSAVDCAVVMIAVKLARENHKHKRDNLVDLGWYVEILHRIKESQQNKSTKQ